MLGSKPVSTPFAMGTSLIVNDGTALIDALIVNDGTALINATM